MIVHALRHRPKYNVDTHECTRHQTPEEEEEEKTDAFHHGLTYVPLPFHIQGVTCLVASGAIQNGAPNWETAFQFANQSMGIPNSQSPLPMTICMYVSGCSREHVYWQG